MMSKEKAVAVTTLACLVVVFFMFYRSGATERINNAVKVVFPVVTKYQGSAVAKSEAEAKGLGGKPFVPTDDKLKEMDLKDLLDITHRYMDHLDYLCLDQRRLGSVFDGGKHVCVDEYIRPPKPCLVYSFGSKNQFDFEADVIKWYGCEVHTFDPFVAVPRAPKGCTFHKLGLAGSVKEMFRQNSTKKFSTLGQIMKDLNHTGRALDILKMDIEAMEWETLHQMVKNNFLANTVRQIAMETHFAFNNATFLRDALTALRELHGAGFLAFSRERNTFCKACSHFSKIVNLEISSVTEFSYINVKSVP